MALIFSQFGFPWFNPGIFIPLQFGDDAANLQFSSRFGSLSQTQT